MTFSYVTVVVQTARDNAHLKRVLLGIVVYILAFLADGVNESFFSLFYSPAIA